MATFKIDPHLSIARTNVHYPAHHPSSGLAFPPRPCRLKVCNPPSGRGGSFDKIVTHTEKNSDWDLRRERSLSSSWGERFLARAYFFVAHIHLLLKGVSRRINILPKMVIKRTCKAELPYCQKERFRQKWDKKREKKEREKKKRCANKNAKKRKCSEVF